MAVACPSSDICPRATWLVALVAAGVCLSIAAAQAGERDTLWLFGTPEVNFEPTLTIENVFDRPRVQELSTGRVRRLPSESLFEAVLAVGVPTQIPHLELTLETIFAPFEEENEPEFEAELNFMLLTEEQTAGWLEAHFDVICQLSPSERPGESRPYTEKLDFELDIAVNPFNWLPSSSWLHHVSAEVSFDYLATGLPRRGDRIDDLLYLDDASGWSLSVLVSLPFAPLSR